MMAFTPGDLVVRAPFDEVHSTPEDKTIEGYAYVVSETGRTLGGAEVLRVEGVTYAPGVWHLAEAFCAYEPVELATEDLDLELAKTIF